MDVLARERAEFRRHGRMVQRRHVLYVQGYDPRGAEAYHQLFRRESDRFRRQWPIGLTLHDLEIQSEEFARWRFDTHTPAWQVATTYDFLRLEPRIRGDMAGPMTTHALRGLGWIADDLVSGTAFRIFRASWRFGVHLLYVQAVLLACIIAAALVGAAAGWVVARGFGWPTLGGVGIALMVALALLLALRRPFIRYVQIVNCWVTLRRFGSGEPTWIDDIVAAAAQRLVAISQANEVDELVVVGHSTGSVIAMAVVARALELDPELLRRSPRLVLLTLGAVMPAVALHPKAERMREVVRRLAVEPTLAWVDCQSRKDIMNFSHLDPIEGVGVHVDGERCRPLIWQVRFRDMVSPEYYRRLRWSFFRMHFQYIMASDGPSLYDYILLIGGPATVPDWTARHDELSFAFISNDATGGQPIAGAPGRP